MFRPISIGDRLAGYTANATNQRVGSKCAVQDWDPESLAEVIGGGCR